MITTVFFDAGNTLVQFDFALFLECLRSLGIHVEPSALEKAHWETQTLLSALAKEIPDHKTRCTHANRAWFSKSGVPKERVEEAVALLFNHPERHRFWSATHPEAKPALEKLKKKGYRLGVISNSEGKMEQILRGIGLCDYLETVVDSHWVGVDKPHPKIFEIGMKRLGVGPKESLYVGDLYEVDVLGAREAGMEPVLFDPNGLYPEVKDCRKIRSLLDLE